MTLVRRICRELVADADRPLLGIGIASPGIVDADGVVVTAAHLGWKDVPLAAELGAEFALPVAVVNDANAAALAELMFGEGTATNLICVRVDEGVGAGLVLDGRLYAGSSYAAGEIGHVVVDPDGTRCACGKRGCLETEVSEPLLARLLEADGSDGTAVLDRAGEHLGTALATVLSALDVTDVVLSGQRTGHHRDVPRRRRALDRGAHDAGHLRPPQRAGQHVRLRRRSSSAPPPGSSTSSWASDERASDSSDRGDRQRSDPRGHGVTRLGITRAEPQHQRPVPSRRTTVNRTRSVRMLAVLATAGLLVAACGGDDDDDSSAATDAPAGTEAAGRARRPPRRPSHRRRPTRRRSTIGEGTGEGGTIRLWLNGEPTRRTRWSSTPSPSSTSSTPTSRCMLERQQWNGIVERQTTALSGNDAPDVVEFGNTQAQALRGRRGGRSTSPTRPPSSAPTTSCRACSRPARTTASCTPRRTTPVPAS